MIAMGLKFLAQNVHPETGALSVGGIVVAAIFGCGSLIVMASTFTVLRAHQDEIDMWKLAQEDSGRASRHMARFQSDICAEMS